MEVRTTPPQKLTKGIFNFYLNYTLPIFPKIPKLLFLDKNLDRISSWVGEDWIFSIFYVFKLASKLYLVPTILIIYPFYVILRAGILSLALKDQIFSSNFSYITIFMLFPIMILSPFYLLLIKNYIKRIRRTRVRENRNTNQVYGGDSSWNDLILVKISLFLLFQFLFNGYIMIFWCVYILL